MAPEALDEVVVDEETRARRRRRRNIIIAAALVVVLMIAALFFFGGSGERPGLVATRRIAPAVTVVVPGRQDIPAISRPARSPRADAGRRPR